MKNSLNYWAFFGMGLLSELIFLLLGFSNSLSVQVLVNFFLVGGLFMVYRFFMDWHYYSKKVEFYRLDETSCIASLEESNGFLSDVSRELRHPVVRKSIMFPAFMGLLMIPANFQLVGVVPLAQIWAWGLVSTLAAWWVVDVLRWASLKLNHAYGFSEVKNKWALRKN